MTTAIIKEMAKRECTTDHGTQKRARSAELCEREGGRKHLETDEACWPEEGEWHFLALGHSCGEIIPPPNYHR